MTEKSHNVRSRCGLANITHLEYGLVGQMVHKGTDFCLSDLGPKQCVQVLLCVPTIMEF
jgi:hypothetical protein